MKRIPRWARWVIGFHLFCFLMLVINEMDPHTAATRAGARRRVCLEQLKAISLAYMQYSQDADSRFPPVSTSEALGWADLLSPYTKTWTIFQCPAAQAPAQERSSDYFYNSHLANISDVDSPEETIAFGDGIDNSGPDAHLSELPSAWLNDPSSPAQRHREGGNYAFADGHVKWFFHSKVDVKEGGAPLKFEVKTQKSSAASTLSPKR